MLQIKRGGLHEFPHSLQLHLVLTSLDIDHQFFWSENWFLKLLIWYFGPNRPEPHIEWQPSTPQWFLSTGFYVHFLAVKDLGGTQLQTPSDLIARNSGNLWVNDPSCVSIYFAVIEANCRALRVTGWKWGKRGKDEAKSANGKGLLVFTAFILSQRSTT